jgi:hypothetical protein
VKDVTAPAASELELRAQRGELTPLDQQRIEWARALRDETSKGTPIAEIARTLNVQRSTLSRFAGSPQYAQCLALVDKPALLANRADAERAIENARNRLGEALALGVDYFLGCFTKAEDGVTYKDEGKAMWATQQLKLGDMLAGQGANKGNFVVTKEAMEALIGAVRHDDKVREADPVADAIDITPTDKQ